MLFTLVSGLLLMGQAQADITVGFNSRPTVEKRSLNKIHQAALAEGGVVTVWHGGDEKSGGVEFKRQFEKTFPGMQLNVTIDLSKYHDGNIDEQLASGHVYVDSIILQTLHDYPRWAQQGALLNYAPLGFERIYPAFKDSTSAAWYGLELFNWNIMWSSDKLPGFQIRNWNDFLKPELKDKIVLTYPHDDDAVLFAFYLIMQREGTAWFDALLRQNPRWVRGSNSPLELAMRPESQWAASFTTGVGFAPPEGIISTSPNEGQFVSWPQTGAILKNAPHPEGAKLLHSWMLTREFQKGMGGWSVRDDVKPPPGFPLPDVMHTDTTNPTAFLPFMADRAKVERLKLWFESRLGTPQGLSPMEDELSN